MSTRLKARVKHRCAIVPASAMPHKNPHVFRSGHCQTHSAGISASGACITTIHVTMACWLSLRVSVLTISDAIAMVRALTNAKSAPVVTSTTPGCKMISVPKNPIQMAAIRRARITSPRNATAPIVTNNGVVKLSAVICASGINVSAVKPQNMPTALMAARRKNNFGRCMRSVPKPTRATKGSKISTARKFRKNTTSITCRCAADSRMHMPMTVNMNSATIIRHEARVCAGKLSKIDII